MFSMRLWVVALIFLREIRDQLRDRRTLFMVFVLPILLYPMLGLLTVQLSTAFAQQLRRVVILGVDRLPAQPAAPERSRRWLRHQPLRRAC